MGTETVVADTSLSITSLGVKVENSSKNRANQNTQVNGTRVNKFWNTIAFSDQRVGPTQRVLKIEAKAYGDVDGQVQANKINQPYEPPYTLVPTSTPETDAMIKYTGEETHNINVVTHYEVWHDDVKEFSANLGEFTLVEET